MARQDLQIQNLGFAGTDITTGQITPVLADGVMYPNQEDLIFRCLNGSGASINVTFQTPYTRDGLALADLVVAVPAGATKLVALHAGEIYSQADGKAYVDFSAVTTVSVNVFRA